MEQVSADVERSTERSSQGGQADGVHQRCIHFDTHQLIEDFKSDCKRRKISVYRASRRVGLIPNTLSKISSGKVNDVTVHTLAKIMAAMNKTDVSKYIIEET